MRIKEQYERILRDLCYVVHYNPYFWIGNNHNQPILIRQTDSITGGEIFDDGVRKIVVEPFGDIKILENNKPIIETSNCYQDGRYCVNVYDYDEDSINCKINTMVIMPKKDKTRVVPSKIVISVINRRNKEPQVRNLTIQQYGSHIDINIDGFPYQVIDLDRYSHITDILTQAIETFMNETSDYSNNGNAHDLFKYTQNALLMSIYSVLEYWRTNYEALKDLCEKEEYMISNNLCVARRLEQERNISFIKSMRG